MSIHYQYLALISILVASLVELVVVVLKRLRSRRSQREGGQGEVARGTNISIILNDGGTAVRIIDLSNLGQVKEVQGAVDLQQVTVAKSDSITLARIMS